MYERPGKLYDIEYECEGQVFEVLARSPRVFETLPWSGCVSFVVFIFIILLFK